MMQVAMKVHAQTQVSTLGEIAATVEMQPAHRRAEEKLTNLRDERARLVVENNALSAAVREAKPNARPDQVSVSFAKIRELEAEIKQLRSTVATMRRERANRIAKALDPICRSTAERALRAAAELESATELFIEASELQRRAGDADAPYLNYPITSSIVAHSKRVLGQ